MSVEKYSVGDKLIVIDKVHGHRFELGERVTVVEKSLFSYRVENEHEDSWYMEDEELERIEEQEVTGSKYLGRCPSCGSRLMWQGDNDTYVEDVYVSTWVCKDCQVEVNKYFGDGLEKEEIV